MKFEDLTQQQLLELRNKVARWSENPTLNFKQIKPREQVRSVRCLPEDLMPGDSVSNQGVFKKVARITYRDKNNRVVFFVDNTSCVVGVRETVEVRL